MFEDDEEEEEEEEGEEEEGDSVLVRVTVREGAAASGSIRVTAHVLPWCSSINLAANLHKPYSYLNKLFRLTLTI